MCACVYVYKCICIIFPDNNSLYLSLSLSFRVFSSRALPALACCSYVCYLLFAAAVAGACHLMEFAAYALRMPGIILASCVCRFLRNVRRAPRRLHRGSLAAAAAAAANIHIP